MSDIVTDDLDDDELSARLARLKEQFANPFDEVMSPGELAREAMLSERIDGEARYFKPLADAADEYIAWARTPGERLYTGIPQFDEAMRGIAPSELALVVGFTHGGKTVLTTEMILNNRRKRIAMFTPDETRTLVLIKLACIVHDVSARQLERDIERNDPSAIELVRSTATKHFPNLAVFDDGLDLPQMRHALRECRRFWGEKEDGVIYDYADLLTGAGEDTPGKITALKSWGKSDRFPLWLLHQSSRSSGANGAKVKIDSGGYGGEMQATFVIGVRRKKHEIMARLDELSEKIETAANVTDAMLRKAADLRRELVIHEDSITFNLVKNKRPGGGLVDDLDFHIDPATGRVRRPDVIGAAPRPRERSEQRSFVSATTTNRPKIRNVPGQRSIDDELDGK